MQNEELGWEGEISDSELPLLVRRRGIAEWKDGVVRLLDRRKLPQEECYLDCKTTEQVATAIKDMVIQGAFSLSIAAGYGLALSEYAGSRNFQCLEEAANQLTTTRPTGLALRRMIDACLRSAKLAKESGVDSVEAILNTVEEAATGIAKQAWRTGQRAAALVEDGSRILTHCFPDRSYVYMMLAMARTGKSINVICSETRPYFQGARLTAMCATQAGMSASVITDSSSGYLMQTGKIDAFITAADRVCMDGTVVNKIGTYMHALAAHRNDVPYYVLRQSGPDAECSNSNNVEIEVRSGLEVTNVLGNTIVPPNVRGIYPCFDKTPPDLVTLIVTDRGIFCPAEVTKYRCAEPHIENAIL